LETFAQDESKGAEHFFNNMSEVEEENSKEEEI